MGKEFKESPLVQKSFQFAVDVIEVYKNLQNDKKEFILSKQLLRAGTSIGANVEEANGAISNPDFKNKISIAYKEARECLYWLKLLNKHLLHVRISIILAISAKNYAKC